MTDRLTASFTFGVQAGGESADDVVCPHYMAFRKALEKRCNRQYGSAIAEFGPVLRIDGNISYWGKDGIDHVRVSKARRTATFDIFMSKSVWMQGDGLVIRKAIALSYQEGMRAVVDRCLKQKLDVDGKKLLEDVDAAVNEFMKS